MSRKVCNPDSQPNGHQRRRGGYARGAALGVGGVSGAGTRRNSSISARAASRSAFKRPTCSESSRDLPSASVLEASARSSASFRDAIAASVASVSAWGAGGVSEVSALEVSTLCRSGVSNISSGTLKRATPELSKTRCQPARRARDFAASLLTPSLSASSAYERRINSDMAMYPGRHGVDIGA